MTDLTVARKNADKGITSDSRRMLSVVENGEIFAKHKSPPQPEEMLKSIVMLIRAELQMDEPRCCRVKKLRIVNNETDISKAEPNSQTGAEGL